MAGDVQLGMILRTAREQAELTLAQVARHIPCSVSQLSNMEAGRRRIYPHVPLAYEQAVSEAGMKRRELLGGIAASLVAPVAASELLQHGFTAALGKTPQVDEWRERIRTHGRDYMLHGASRVQKSITNDLVVLPQNLDTPEMWSITARALAIYGKTTQGSQEALRWYKLALTAAERSRSDEAYVWVTGRAALALGYEGAALPSAMTFAEQALQRSSAPTSGRLNALMGKAQIHAYRGEREAAFAAWDDVRRLYDTLSPDESITDFNYPYWRLAVVGSLLFSRLGDSRAEHWQAESDRYRPDTMVRFATHIDLHKGLLLARQGGKDEGLAHAEAALKALPDEKRSQSLTLLLHEVRQ